MSTGKYRGMMVCMMSTLAEFTKTKREAMGLNQTELARRSGLPRTTINRIESGTTKLPGPEIRRQLAAGLGVTHLDLLIAAGELRAEEVREAGVEGVVADGAARPADELHEVIDWFDWSPDQVEAAKISIMSTQPMGRRMIAAITSSFFTGVMKFSEFSEEEREHIRRMDPDQHFDDDSEFYLLEEGKEPNPALSVNIEDDDAMQALARRMIARRQRTAGE